MRNNCSHFCRKLYCPYRTLILEKHLEYHNLIHCLECNIMICPSHRIEKLCLLCYPRCGRKWRDIEKILLNKYPLSIIQDIRSFIMNT